MKLLAGPFCAVVGVAFAFAACASSGHENPDGGGAQGGGGGSGSGGGFRGGGPRRAEGRRAVAVVAVAAGLSVAWAPARRCATTRGSARACASPRSDCRGTTESSATTRA